MKLLKKTRTHNTTYKAEHPTGQYVPDTNRSETFDQKISFKNLNF